MVHDRRYDALSLSIFLNKASKLSHLYFSFLSILMR